MIENPKQHSSMDIWEKVWDENTINGQLLNLQKDEYFEHVTNLAKNIPKKGRILEAGCGLGRWIFYLNELGFYTIGIDTAKTAIKRAHKYAKKKRKNIDLVVADVEHLPFRDHAFDLILSLGVIEHFVKGNRDHIIKESYRCLNQKGMLFLTTPNKFLIAHTLLRFYSKLRREWKVGLEHSFTTKDLTRFLKAQNFRITRQTIFGFKFASTKRISFLPFLWPFVKIPSIRSYVYDVLTHLCRGLKLIGFYAV